MNNDDETPVPRPPADATYRLQWAALIQRVFAADVLECGRCHGRMRVLGVIEESATVVIARLRGGVPPTQRGLLALLARRAATRGRRHTAVTPRTLERRVHSDASEEVT